MSDKCSDAYRAHLTGPPAAPSSPRLSTGAEMFRAGWVAGLRAANDLFKAAGEAHAQTSGPEFHRLHAALVAFAALLPAPPPSGGE